MPTNGVIEIFVKTDNGHTVGATFEDDDDDVAFVNMIFPEAMMDFVNSEGDPIRVAKYNVDTIEKRINIFKINTFNLNGTVTARLDSILHFIKNNINVYEGIKVYI